MEGSKFSFTRYLWRDEFFFRKALWRSFQTHGILMVTANKTLKLQIQSQRLATTPLSKKAMHLEYEHRCTNPNTEKWGLLAEQSSPPHPPQKEKPSSHHSNRAWELQLIRFIFTLLLFKLIFCCVSQRHRADYTLYYIFHTVTGEWFGQGLGYAQCLLHKLKLWSCWTEFIKNSCKGTVRTSGIFETQNATEIIVLEHDVKSWSWDLPLMWSFPLRQIFFFEEYTLMNFN